MKESMLASEILDAAKKGEDSAWNLLYHKYQPILYASALHLLGNTPAARDAVQDAFLLAYLQLHQLKNINAFGAWIKKFSTTIAIVHFIHIAIMQALMPYH